MENAITIFILIIGIITVIGFKGVKVTNKDKGIVNQQMSWIDFF